jgi:predicted acyltransferase
MSESSHNVETGDKTRERLLSLDMYKGLTIILMVFVNSISQFTNTPAWTKHAVDFGLTYVDLIAPFFIFMMALNYKSSFKRRLEQPDKSKVYIKFIQRYLIFLGLGLVLYINLDPAGNVIFQWGTLQVLGVSGLMLLPLIMLPAIVRLVIGFGGLVVHQLLLETGLKQIIFDGYEGGIWSSLSWASMLII